MNNSMPLRGEHAAIIRDVSRSPAWAKLLPYIDARKLHAFVED
jgi:hypothetical protein